MPSTSRSRSLPLVGLILAVDGVAAVLLSGASFVMSLSVAAIEGQSGDPNSNLVLWAVAFLLVAIVAFGTAWRAVRGVGRERLAGAAVAAGGAAAGAWLIWSSATANPSSMPGLAVGAGIVLAHLAAMRALVTWKSSPSVTSDPHSGGIGVR